ncbi:DNA polymerase eta (Eurofung) [Rasamsonia emersonii CBS 393.64]|uniref:DNA polymerase eta n=1 Tax=Rasamsonia emersonii (strain ATCC 16479 / CBS 393.64 / IMI 116815) TaxID=1408163 RepID=A0A0F4YKE4_RASE3|nr:DNA polymerase eta (Eurofung) [Rasamsonia emersonii CBS 393.64]KKA18679.1 DNA polymerase eta (Eurofung) [Rasamsonia emersonii CBS 393.64]
MPRSPSPQPFIPSSPGPSLKRSRYTYRHLQLLRQNSPSSPLRVIAHLDLDAFYAQCEMVRLGTPRDTPLAVQQWDSLIAINYAARPFGITRMLSASEAKKRCPELVLQHVATFREGEGGKWAYREDAFRSIKTDKVSLDPYRAESRKILSLIKEELSKWRDRLAVIEGGALGQLQPAKLEKASIDEVFIDLSSLVSGVLFERYPELREPPTGDDKTAVLPSPPTTALDWHPEDGLVDLDDDETEEDDPDWDDIAMLIGSEIVRSVRNAVWEKLNYTCSAGIARNKMMAKLGSACNKPNKQTVVRNRAVQKFLGGFKFTKIRMLGGKLGDQITALFGTEEVSELLKVPLEQFKAKLDDDTATWLYGIIRGEDHSEVNTRTQMKSMLSAKSFRPSINSVDQAEKWLRIFAADLYGRLVEDGILENRRRPRTITLHHRQGAQVRSRQIPIPGGKTIDEALLFELGKTLLGQVVADGQIWPCANLSLSVGGFEDGVANNRAIDGFLVRGQEAISMGTLGTGRDTSDEQGRAEKRRKVEDTGIQRFFKKDNRVGDDSDLKKLEHQASFKDSDANAQETPDQDLNTEGHDDSERWENRLPEDLAASYICPRCNKSLPEFERSEHDDWHFAKDLERQEMEAARSQTIQRGTGQTSKDARKTKPKPRTTGRGGTGKPEKGQTRLTF